MKLKFIQINIYKGRYFDELVDFLKEEAPDFISMQEVSAGKLNNYESKDVNLFELLSQKLSYKGVFHSDVEILGDPNASFGNAVFSKWPILDSKIVVLNTFRPMTLTEFVSDPAIWASISRHMLDVVCQVGGVGVHAISVHGRRIAPPVDNPESTRQANLIVDHLRFLGNEPFVVGGDFNMPPETSAITIVSRMANNLMQDLRIKQTLNPAAHELGEHGYLVDYIFTSKHFELKSLAVPQVTVSDHLPVIAQLELLF